MNESSRLLVEASKWLDLTSLFVIAPKPASTAGNLSEGKGGLSPSPNVLLPSANHATSVSMLGEGPVTDNCFAFGLQYPWVSMLHNVPLSGIP